MDQTLICRGALELASVPDKICNFVHIKLRNVEAAKACETGLLGLLRGKEASASAA
jgi:hypothetical protein